MAAFLPIALGISGLLSHIATAVGVAVLVPIMSKISQDLATISRAGVFQAGFMKVADAMNGLQMVGLQVYIVNPEFLDNVAATRWAITYFSDVTAMKQLGFLFDIYRVENEILDALKHLLGDLLFFTIASYRLQLGMLSELRQLPVYARVLNGTMLFVGSVLHQDLQAILAAIRAMATVTLVVVTLLVPGGGGAQPLTSDGFWKWFGRIAAILGLIVAFVGLLGLALRAFNESAWIGIVAVAAIAVTMGLLIKALSGYKWSQIGVIAVSLLMIAVFVGLLGLALRAFTNDATVGVKAVAGIAVTMGLLFRSLSGYNWDQIGVIAVALLLIVVFVGLLGLALRAFDKDSKAASEAVTGISKAMTRLFDALKEITWDQMKVIGVGLLFIALFVAALGFSLRTFSADALKPVKDIGALFDSLIKLAQAIAEFTPDQLIRIGLGFLGIVVFLALLGLVLRLFDAAVLNALPGLGKLLDSIGDLATKLASLTPGQMIAIAIGLLGIAGFIALLGLALGTFTQTAIAAMGPLGELFDSLLRLTTALAAFSPGDLVTLGIAFLLIAGFVFLLAIALRIAEPGLRALADVLQGIEGVMDRVSAAASRLWSFLSPVLNGIKSLGSSIDVNSMLSGQLGAPSASAAGAALPTASPGAGFPGLPPALPPTGGAAGVAAGAEGSGGAQLASALGGAGLAGLGAGAAGGAQRVDQSVNVQGGLNVNISAERLEADSAQMLSDQIVLRLSERLAALRGEQDFRVGARPAAPA